MFDLEKIASRNGIVADWTAFDKEKALNLNMEYVAATMRRIAQEVITPDFSSDLRIEMSLASMILYVLRDFAKVHDPGITRRLSRSELESVQVILEDTGSMLPSLHQLGSALGMSSRKLSSAYRATTGLTLRSRVAKSRLNRAKTLLAEGNLSIKQISFWSGFNSFSSFSAAFRRETGLTPSQFRAGLRT